MIPGIGICLYPEMETAISSKVLVNLYDTGWLHSPEDSVISVVTALQLLCRQKRQNGFLFLS